MPESPQTKVRFSSAELQAIDKEAAARGLGRSAFVRMATLSVINDKPLLSNAIQAVEETTFRSIRESRRVLDEARRLVQDRCPRPESFGHPLRINIPGGRDLTAQEKERDRLQVMEADKRQQIWREKRAKVVSEVASKWGLPEQEVALPPKQRWVVSDGKQIPAPDVL